MVYCQGARRINVIAIIIVEIYRICPYRGWAQMEASSLIEAGSQIVAGFAAIDTECLSINAFVLLSNCKLLVTLHDYSCQARFRRESRMMSPSS